jgi:hypothetical protein
VTIASNRIRFLDRETRILVQDFSDLSDNTPLTDVETPFSIEAMDLIEAGYAMLLTFGREIIALLDSLSDGNITDFLLNTILNNIRLNVPGFPAVAVFVNTLRNTNPQAFAGFVNALIADASNTIFETPSLIQSNSGDVKSQIINIALNRFATRLANGEVTTEYVNELANSGTEDPYQIKSTVAKILNDYKYAANEQEKYKLPTDEKVAETLICHLSLTLGYYNYLYSTLKLTDKVTKAEAFVTSINNNTKVYLEQINELKSEIGKSSVDHDSLFYYVEQMSREMTRAMLTFAKGIDFQTQLPLLSTQLTHSQTVMSAVLSYMKSKVGKEGTEMYQESSASAFVNALFSRIKDGTLIYDSTLPNFADIADRLVFGYEGYLRRALYSHISAGNSYKNQTATYVLVNARNSVYKLLIDQRGQCTDVQLKTLFGILELFYQQDIFRLEGDHSSSEYGFRTIEPMIVYEKMTPNKFFTVCLRYLQLMERQFYITYPKTGTIGLLSNMVEKMNQVRLDLVKNNFYVRNVILDVNSTYVELQTVLTLEWLHSNFFPITFNSYDTDIYTLYKKDLNRFVFSSENVRTS